MQTETTPFAISVHAERIHALDHAGQPAGSVTAPGHTMTVRPWWEDCGMTGETVRCSCGAFSVEAFGSTGCRAGHEPSEHTLDAQHAAMLAAFHDAGRRCRCWRTSPQPRLSIS